jgi:prolyl oligopeptidase PreP (S9A serine peptidase family)
VQSALYFEHTGGSHDQASSPKERANQLALVYTNFQSQSPQ